MATRPIIRSRTLLWLREENRKRLVSRLPELARSIMSPSSNWGSRRASSCSMFPTEAAHRPRQRLQPATYPLGLLAISSVLPFLQSDRVRVLAVTTSKRSSFNPAWKTLQEDGVPDIDASNWVGMFAPKNVPKPIIDKLYDEIQRILVTADIQGLFAVGGADTTPMRIADFCARIRADAARFQSIVKEAGVQAE